MWKCFLTDNKGSQHNSLYSMGNQYVNIMIYINSGEIFMVIVMHWNMCIKYTQLYISLSFLLINIFDYVLHHY